MAKKVIRRSGNKPTTKKAAPKKAAPKAATPKPAAKRLDEKGLIAKYPHVVARTLEFNEDGKYAGKQTVTIRCQEPGCKARRTVATSDLFQVTMCEEHTSSNRRARRAAARKTAVSA
jgi:hypothetical protein